MWALKKAGMSETQARVTTAVLDIGLGAYGMGGSTSALKGTEAATTAAAEGVEDAAQARRAYLNAKFGRTGDLNADINARGVTSAIMRNAEDAAGLARLDRANGLISQGRQAFGTRAHSFFETLNNRLANRVAGTFRVATEEFRNPLGMVVARRSAQSIGADVIVRPWSAPGPVIYDLKTFGGAQVPIGAARQLQFLLRFGARANEIYVWSF